MDKMMKDERFTHILKDPKFRKIPKGERKVKIDKRFQSMFKDKKFAVKYTIDKRGRPVNQTTSEDFRKYYDLSSEEEDNTSSDESKSSEEPEKSDLESSKSDSDIDNKLEVRSRKKLEPEVKKKLRDLTVDYARGEGVLLSDSSSEEDNDSEKDDDHDDDDEIEHNWGELDKEAETTEQATSRLAACNMDWDRIRAVDLMVLFNSFLPPSGLIRSVTIYPSEFGLKRMAEEEVKGPTELVQEHSDEDEEDSDLQMEKLRQYQLSRLKYYYAVIVFDSAGTANKVYTECDGIEYESSATKLDLRFIPDDMIFDGQEPKEFCDQLPEMANYKPRIFANTALQQAKVDLTWDETNLDRKEFNDRINKANLDELNKNDLQAYLASGTSDEEEQEDRVKKAIEKSKDSEGKDSIASYKLLLKAIEDEDEEKRKRDVQLEFTWGLGEKESDEDEQEEEKIKKDNLTPFEKYLEKRKDKKRKKKMSKNDSSDSEDEVETVKPKRYKDKDEATDDEDQKKKQELELLLMDKNDDNKHHFNMKQIEKEQSLSKSKKKRLKKKNKSENTGKEDNFTVNVDDPRFSALYTSHKYNIDPTDPNYKKTKGTEDLVKEQIKRREKTDKCEEVNIGLLKKNETPISSEITPELAALVNSVKRKTKNVNKKIK